jgi:hypothetical protein
MYEAGLSTEQSVRPSVRNLTQHPDVTTYHCLETRYWTHLQGSNVQGEKSDLENKKSCLQTWSADCQVTLHPITDEGQPLLYLARARKLTHDY